MASLEQTNTLLGLSDIRSFEQQLLTSIKG
jgi:hypothetical protein